MAFSYSCIAFCLVLTLPEIVWPLIMASRAKTAVVEEIGNWKTASIGNFWLLKYLKIMSV